MSDKSHDLTRVFIVEDSELLRRRIVDNVQALGGFEVVPRAGHPAPSARQLVRGVAGQARVALDEVHARVGDLHRMTQFTPTQIEARVPCVSTATSTAG